MLIVVTGGKTGGHVYPALAVVESLRRLPLEPKSSSFGENGNGHPGPPEFLYVGFAGGTEEGAAPEAGVPLMKLKLTTPDRMSRLIPFALQTLWGVVRCVCRFNANRPAVLFSTGGFVSIPATVAAWSKRVPIVIFLPDTHPGKAVRFTARLATNIAVVNAATIGALKGTRVAVTGYPVRKRFLELDRSQARTAMGLSDGELQLLVTGGSQGSAAINRAISDALPAILEFARVLHVCGPRHLKTMEAARSALSDRHQSRYRLVGSLDSDQMAEAMFASDLAITRGGASILGELPMTGLPSIVIPLPIAGVNQSANAQALADQGACVVLPEDELGEGRLCSMVETLLADGAYRQRITTALVSLRTPDAALDIAALVQQASRPSRAA